MRETRFSKRLTHYGAEGLEDEERLLALAQAQRKVMQRLIDAEAALLGAQSDVVHWIARWRASGNSYSEVKQRPECESVRAAG
jgi:hypothetical protein